MPQMSPMTWMILSTVYAMIMMIYYTKMSKSQPKVKEQKKSEIKIMEMKW